MKKKAKEVVEAMSNENMARALGLLCREAGTRKVSPRQAKRIKDGFRTASKAIEAQAELWGDHPVTHKAMSSDDPRRMRNKKNAVEAPVSIKAERVTKEEESTKARSFRISPEVLERVNIASAFRDEKIGEFVEKAIVERIARLEKERGRPFPRKDGDQ